MKKTRKISQTVRIAVLSLLAVLFALPVIMTAVNSFSFGESSFTFKGYSELFVSDFGYIHYLLNSVLYASIITVISISISLPLGFVFAKIPFKGRDTLFFVYIVVMMLPFQATLLSSYIQLREFNMLNTPLALTVPMIFSPFATFFFRQSMKNIPNEFIDFASLETSSVFKVFRHIIIPHIKPAIVSLAILIFCESWNMVDQGRMFSMDNESIQPLSVMLSQIPENLSFVGATVYMLPIIVVFCLFRETLEDSMENYSF